MRSYINPGCGEGSSSRLGVAAVNYLRPAVLSFVVKLPSTKMCSRFCEGGYYLTWLCIVTLVTRLVEGNAAYAELTSTDAVSLRGLSHDPEEYAMSSLEDTKSMLGVSDRPLYISERADLLYSEDPVLFPADNAKVPRRAVEERPAPQTRHSEDYSRDLVIKEAYVVGHLPEKHLKPPGKAFWVEKLMILGLLAAWIVIAHRAVAEESSYGLSRVFVTIWTLSLLMSVLKKAPERTHVIVASTGVNIHSARNAGANKVSLRKIFANVLSLILTFFLILLFGPIIFFITGAVLTLMLAAVFAIAICLLRSPAVQQNLMPHDRD